MRIERGLLSTVHRPPSFVWIPRACVCECVFPARLRRGKGWDLSYRLHSAVYDHKLVRKAFWRWGDDGSWESLSDRSASP